MELLLAGNKRLRLEALSYIMLVAGTLGDHFSTVIALTQPYIYESNPFTVLLMSKGLWLPVDILLVTVGILIPYLILRLTSNPSFYAVLAYPIVHGLVRLGACLWNFSLIV